MKLFLLALAMVAALLVGGIGGYMIGVRTRTVAPAPDTALPPTHEVAYRVPVSQCTEISASYNLPAGSKVSTSRICPDAAVVASFSAQRGDSLYLSAQNQSHPDNRNHFACEIVVDGMILAQVEAVGFSEIASCSATVP